MTNFDILYQSILPNISKLRPREGRNLSWTGCCPAHHDQHPSLGVAIGVNDQILLYCSAGCTLEEICQALGIGVGDLFPAKPVAHGGCAFISRDDVRELLLHHLLILEQVLFAEQNTKNHKLMAARPELKGPLYKGFWEQEIHSVKVIMRAFQARYGTELRG